MTTNPDTSQNLTIFPELLSLETLRLIIKQRHPKLSNLNTMSHDKALTIFRTMVMPLPQRDYSSNTRGHRLQQRRKRSGVAAESHPKISFISTPPPKRPSSSDRLKPPPSNTSPTKTRITSQSDSKGSARQLVINDRSALISPTNSQKRTASGNKNGADVTVSKPKKQKITWP